MGLPPPDLIRAVGWTLVHFLWQGALIAALMGLALRAAASARTRHDLSFIALLAMAATPVVTFLLVRTGAPVLVMVPYGLAEAGSAYSWQAPVVAVWCAGVALLAVRMAGGLWLIERFRREAIALPAAWAARCVTLNLRMPTALPVLFRQSREVAGPMVVGWFKPVVLIPSAALLRLPANQLEAVILHELAHVRRFDAFVNLFQTLVETLLFYHPAVWWVSRRLRVERENCCDDLAVQASGDRTAYVRALVSFETMSQTAALAAGGPGVRARAARLLGMEQGPERAPLSRLGALVVLAIGLTVAASGSAVVAAPDTPPAATATTPRAQGPLLTVRDPLEVRPIDEALSAEMELVEGPAAAIAPAEGPASPALISSATPSAPSPAFLEPVAALENYDGLIETSRDVAVSYRASLDSARRALAPGVGLTRTNRDVNQYNVDRLPEAIGLAERTVAAWEEAKAAHLAVGTVQRSYLAGAASQEDVVAADRRRHATVAEARDLTAQRSRIASEMARRRQELVDQGIKEQAATTRLAEAPAGESGRGGSSGGGGAASSRAPPIPPEVEQFLRNSASGSTIGRTYSTTPAARIGSGALSSSRPSIDGSAPSRNQPSPAPPAPPPVERWPKN